MPAMTQVHTLPTPPGLKTPEQTVPSHFEAIQQSASTPPLDPASFAPNMDVFSSINNILGGTLNMSNLHSNGCSDDLRQGNETDILKSLTALLNGNLHSTTNVVESSQTSAQLKTEAALKRINAILLSGTYCSHGHAQTYTTQENPGIGQQVWPPYMNSNGNHQVIQDTIGPNNNFQKNLTAAQPIRAEDPVTVKGVLSNRTLEKQEGQVLQNSTIDNGNSVHQSFNSNGNTLPSHMNGNSSIASSELLDDGNSAMFRQNAATLTKMIQQSIDSTSDSSGVSSSSDSTCALTEMIQNLHLQQDGMSHGQQHIPYSQNNPSQSHTSQGQFQSHPQGHTQVPPMPYSHMNQPQISQLEIMQAMQAQREFIQRQTVEELIKKQEENAQRNYQKQNWSFNQLLNGKSYECPDPIEQLAKEYRNAAAKCEATCTWSGQLPRKVMKSPNYSCKVFLGGVPWDITEANLSHVFRSYGRIQIEWPRRDGKHPRCPDKAGYVYVLFDNEKSVKALLADCTNHDCGRNGNGEYYFKISSKKMRSKEVQVIPWALGDTNHIRLNHNRLDPSKTVFVGALHGMLNAEGLAHILNDLFGGVIYAGIDTDKHKYPIGSGRVTFNNAKSYMKAVMSAFVEIKTPKFVKKIQIDPYLEDSQCKVCNYVAGPFFCRDLACFKYYCRSCWQWAHSWDGCAHKPLMRNRTTTG